MEISAASLTSFSTSSGKILEKSVLTAFVRNPGTQNEMKLFNEICKNFDQGEAKLGLNYIPVTSEVVTKLHLSTELNSVQR
jgi:hypothetical protein